MSRQAPAHAPTDRPAGWRLAAFASLQVAIGAASMPITAYVPAFYAQHLGMGLGAVGLVFMLTRLWDAFNDPLIGYFSDQTRSRWGRRKPWILAGLPLYAAAVWVVFLPQGSPSPLALGIALSVLYLGWTMFSIPHMAWSGEISGHYHERTRVQTYVAAAGALGLLLVLGLPVLLDQTGHGDPRLKLAVMGGFVVVATALTGAAALLSFRELPAPPRPKVRLGIRRALAFLVTDRLLQRVLVSDFLVTLGQLTRGSLLIIFLTSYMGLAKAASLVLFTQYFFGVFAGPIWLRISYRLGKHKTLIAAELTQSAINFTLLLVTPSAWPLLVALTIAQGLTQSSGNLMLRAMVADVADKQRLESGEERAGVLFSIFSLTGKAGQAVAVGIAFPLIGALGYSATGANTAEGLLGLKLVFALGPALAHLASAALLWRYPLDQARHAEIRHALDARDAEMAQPPRPRAAALTPQHPVLGDA